MSTLAWDIDNDLRAWAEWSRYQTGVRVKYISIQPFMRMRQDTEKGCEFSISDEYAMVVDRAIANLKPLNDDLYAVIKLYYLSCSNQQVVAKKLGWSLSQVKQKLSVARDVVKGMVHCLQLPAANDARV